MSMPLYLEQLCKTVAQKAEPHARDGQADAGTNADPRRVEQKGTAARNNGAPLGRGRLYAHAQEAEPVSYTHLDVYKRQGLW